MHPRVLTRVACRPCRCSVLMCHLFLYNDLWWSINRVQVWMDEYKEIFYRNRAGSRGVQYGDISERVALRKQ